MGGWLSSFETAALRPPQDDDERYRSDAWSFVIA
jgi:hypothetical protein